MVLSWLHTSGKYFKDGFGRTVYLRGSAIYHAAECKKGVAQNWGNKGQTHVGGGINGEETCIDCPGYAANSLDLLKSTGANVVRLGVNPWAWLGVDWFRDGKNENCVGLHPTDARYVHSTQEYRDNLDYMVSELAKRGIYSILDPHHIPPINQLGWADYLDNGHFDEFKLWLQEIALHYLNEPSVCGIEVGNEPRSLVDSYPYSGYWWDYCLDVAQTIHSVNPKLIVFVPSCLRSSDDPGGQMSDSGYKQVSSQFFLNPLPEPNVAYVWHHHFTHREDWAGIPDDPNNPLKFWWDYVNGNYEEAKEGYENYLYRLAFRASEQYNLPIINTEWNLNRFRWDTLEKCLYDSYVVLEDFLEIMNRYGASYMWWGWGGSVGYPWDKSYDDATTLVYSSKLPEEPIIWNALSYHGEIFKSYASPPTLPPSARGWLLALLETLAGLALVLYR